MAKVPIVNQTGLIFRETFRNVSDVLENGGTVGSGITVDEGSIFPSTASIDYGTNKIDPSGVTGFTMIATIKSTAGALNDGVMGFWDGTRGIFMQSRTTGGAGLLVLAGLSADYGQVDVDTVTDFVQAALVYDGTLTGNSGRLKLYVNGVAQTLTFPGTAAIATSLGTLTNKSFKIGDISTLARYWAGEMKGVMVYNRALSQAEILDIYEEDTFKEVDDSLTRVSLPLRSNYYDGGKQVTENIGALGGMVQLGDGTTLTTFPTQLSPKGMRFDGSTDYLNFGVMTSIEGASSLSMSVWVKPGALSDFDGFLVKGNSLSNRIFFGMSGAGFNGSSAVLIVFANGVNSFGITAAGVLAIGRLTHLTMVFNGTGATDADRLKLYVDSVLIPLTFTLTIPATTPTNGLSLLGGNDSASGGRFFNGQMFTPRIHDIALTPTQVKWLYQKDLQLINT